MPGKFTKPPPGAMINWGHTLARGLVAAPIFNEGAGAASDLVKRRVGTLTNGAAWVTHTEGLVIDLDGTDDYVSVPHDADLMFSSSFTVVARVLFDAAASGGDDVIVGKTLHGTSQTGYFLVERNATTAIDFGFFNGAAYKIAQGVTLVGTGTWATVAGVFDDAADTNTIFLNGIQDAQVGTVGNLVSNTDNVEIGSKSNAAAKSLDGKVAWVYFFNVVKTPAELRGLHAEPYAFLLEQSPKKYFYGALVGAPLISASELVTLTELAILRMPLPASVADAVTATDGSTVSIPGGVRTRRLLPLLGVGN